MLCDAARDRLLIADDPSSPDADLAEHLSGCAGCRAVAADLVGLEHAVRAFPTPASVLVRRDALLDNLTATAPRPVRTRHVVVAFVALAASVAVCVVAVALLRPVSPDASTTLAVRAEPVVEDLIEWNLMLTEANEPADREKLIHDRLSDLQTAVLATPLSADDRAFAEQLLAHGRKLGGPTDPVDEAEQFHELADTLLIRLDTAAEDPKRSVVYARLYSQVVDRGVEVNLARASRQALKAEKQARVQDLQKAKKKQAAKAAAVADRIPETAREHMKIIKAKLKGGNSSPK